jgi:hypothetical protein
MARAGRGKAIFVTDNERLQPQVSGYFTHILLIMSDWVHVALSVYVVVHHGITEAFWHNIIIVCLSLQAQSNISANN